MGLWPWTGSFYAGSRYGPAARLYCDRYYEGGAVVSGGGAGALLSVSFGTATATSAGEATGAGAGAGEGAGAGAGAGDPDTSTEGLAIRTVTARQKRGAKRARHPTDGFRRSISPRPAAITSVSVSGITVSTSAISLTCSSAPILSLTSGSLSVSRSVDRTSDILSAPLRPFRSLAACASFTERRSTDSTVGEPSSREASSRSVAILL